jgi:hypothetical protein
MVPTFVDRGVSRSQRGGSPTVVNLSFLDRSRYFLSSSSSFILTRAEWTPFQTYCYSENLVASGIEPGTSGCEVNHSSEMFETFLCRVTWRCKCLQLCARINPILKPNFIFHLFTLLHDRYLIQAGTSMSSLSAAATKPETSANQSGRILLSVPAAHSKQGRLLFAASREWTLQY